jgi:hypothetical protein
VGAVRLRHVVAVALALGSVALLVYWLGRGERPPVPIGAIVLAAASLLTLVVPAPRRRRRRRPRAARGSPAQIASGRTLPILALLVLSAIGAELLAAYDDTTGRPGAITFAVVFFAALYGCPALLIRELARRTGRGWPAMVVLAAAVGVLEAGAIDQALFADSYEDVSNWEETVRATYVAPLGLAAFPAQNFIVGHVLFSFCAPVALAEAIRPEIAHRPWLGRPGLVVAAGAWLTAAGLILSDALREGYATWREIAVTLGLVAALVAAALLLRLPQRATRRAPRTRTVLAASFGLTTAATAVPETWAGFGIALAVVATAIWLLLRFAGGPGWTLGHTAAVGAGALLSRGALAFLYYPLVGETSAAQKYTHNVVMLLVVAAIAVVAHRRSRVRPA